MIVQRLTSWNEASTLKDPWNTLAQSIPFRRWEWLGTWWQHYGRGREWFVLAVYDEWGRLAGVAPWFVEHVPAFGRVVQFLGAGETCSDHLSVLCARQDSTAVTNALAEWLMNQSCSASGEDWNMINLDGVLSDDPVVCELLKQLEQLGCMVHRQNGFHSWRVPLPGTWDEYRSQLSKPNRRHVRVLQERLVDTGTVNIQAVESPDEFSRVWPLFVDLHQRRRQGLGQSGCFASPAFAGFARQVAEEFLRLGKLELLWIERAGEPMAAQLALIDGGVTYAYQVGVNPEMLADSPGWLVHTQSIKRAIAKGHMAFDFLRGDEPHKQRMGGEPQSMLKVRVVPPQLGATVLHKAWVTGTTVKNWIKAGLERTGMR